MIILISLLSVSLIGNFLLLFKPKFIEFDSKRKAKTEREKRDNDLRIEREELKDMFNYNEKTARGVK